MYAKQYILLIVFLLLFSSCSSTNSQVININKIEFKEPEKLSGTNCKSLDFKNYENNDIWKNVKHQLKHNNGYKDHGCTIVNNSDNFPVRSGELSLRFETKDGDCNSNQGWDDCTTDRSRHELTEWIDKEINNGDEIFYAYSIFFNNPLYTKNTATFLGQINTDNSARFYIRAFDKGLGYMFNDKDYEVLESDVFLKWEEATNTWIDIGLHIKFSTSDDGFIKLYINNQLIKQLDGKNFDGVTSVHLDFGIYNAFVSRCDCEEYPTKVVYFDEIFKSDNENEFKAFIGNRK